MGRVLTTRLNAFPEVTQPVVLLTTLTKISVDIFSQCKAVVSLDGVVYGKDIASSPFWAFSSETWYVKVKSATFWFWPSMDGLKTLKSSSYKVILPLFASPSESSSQKT